MKGKKFSDILLFAFSKSKHNIFSFWFKLITILEREWERDSYKGEKSEEREKKVKDREIDRIRDKAREGGASALESEKEGENESASQRKN